MFIYWRQFSLWKYNMKNYKTSKTLNSNETLHLRKNYSFIIKLYGYFIFSVTMVTLISLKSIKFTVMIEMFLKSICYFTGEFIRNLLCAKTL